MQNPPMTIINEKIFSSMIANQQSEKSKMKIGNRIAIYGAGNTGKDIFHILCHHNMKVECFIDVKAQETTQWSGVPVLTPKNRKLVEFAREKVDVIIGVFNRDVEILPILNMLREIGFENIINFPVFFQHFSNELGNRFWLGKHDNLIKNCDKIDEAYLLFNDSSSQRLYRAIFEFRLTGDFSLLPLVETSPQYFPEDILSKVHVDRFIDCGAYDGDTMQFLNKTKGKIESAICFEPDKINFDKLLAYVGNNRDVLAKEVLTFPCGVWSQSVCLGLCSDQGEASHLTTDRSNGTTIQCVALDDVLLGWHPTYIKMDIEGAETDALFGSERVIRTCKPALAICVYHRPQDIWDIPLLINSWNLGYSFYLRCYAQATFDTVLYAIPQ
jgi:FkbM family methyltransferase